jgi:hypothetical protein
MGIIFNADGTVTRTKEVENLQETLIDELKKYDEHLKVGFDELRIYRDQELGTSDWTQVSDNALNSTTKNAWATYRSKLRNLPADTKAPFWFTKSDWPIAPGASEINSDALKFIERNNDPLGIATTSWVGVGTDGVYFRQEKPTLSITISTASTIYNAASTTNVDFKVNTVNMVVEDEYFWKIEGSDPAFENVKGCVKVIPDSTTHQGIGTVSVSIGSSIFGQITSDDTLTLSLDLGRETLVHTVGVVTT